MSPGQSRTLGHLRNLLPHQCPISVSHPDRPPSLPEPQARRIRNLSLSCNSHVQLLRVLPPLPWLLPSPERSPLPPGPLEWALTSVSATELLPRTCSYTGDDSELWQIATKSGQSPAQNPPLAPHCTQQNLTQDPVLQNSNGAQPLSHPGHTPLVPPESGHPDFFPFLIRSTLFPAHRP